MKEEMGFKGQIFNLEMTYIDYTDLEFWKENPRFVRLLKCILET